MGGSEKEDRVAATLSLLCTGTRRDQQSTNVLQWEMFFS
jgi:hypothetical protein